MEMSKDFIAIVDELLTYGEHTYGELYLEEDIGQYIIEKVHRFKSSSHKGGNPIDLAKIAACAYLWFLKERSKA